MKVVFELYVRLGLYDKEKLYHFSKREPICIPHKLPMQQGEYSGERIESKLKTKYDWLPQCRFRAQLQFS